MSEQDVIQQLQSVLLWAAVIAFLFGAIMQRTGFCTMGAVTDLISVQDSTRLRQWALAISVSVAGCALLQQAGLINLSKTLYLGARLNPLSILVGSFFFGIGMVLAAGCSSKTLVRMGEGNLKAVVVFLALGLSAWMTLKGVFGVIRINTVDRVSVQLGGGADLAALLQSWGDFSAASLSPLAAAGVALLFAGYAFVGRQRLGFATALAGLGIGACCVAFFYVSGAMGYVAEDPNTLEEVYLASSSGRLEGLSFVAPYAQVMEWLVFFSDTSRKVTLGLIIVPAVVLGAAASALASGGFHWQGFSSTEELTNHLIGGVLMGVGGVTALGCTVGQGLTGVATLSLGSLLALPGFIAGGLLGMKYLTMRHLPAPCVPLKYTKKDGDPVNLQRHNDTFSTAGQITLADLSEIARMGFRSVINNRPDGEGGAEQVANAEVAKACESLGLQYAYLPVVSGQLKAEEAAQMAQLLETMPHPIVAFCRSGARSTQLYQMARHMT